MLDSTLQRRHCWVSLKYGEDLDRVGTSSYMLPDGQVVAVGPEKIIVSEVPDPNLEFIQLLPDLTLSDRRSSTPSLLADPTFFPYTSSSPRRSKKARSSSRFISFPFPSSYELLTVIQPQPELWSNIIVGGGTSNLSNLLERLEQELLPLAPAGQEVKVRNEDRHYATWEGLYNYACFGGENSVANRWFVFNFPAANRRFPRVSLFSSPSFRISKDQFEEIGEHCIDALY